MNDPTNIWCGIKSLTLFWMMNKFKEISETSKRHNISRGNGVESIPGGFIKDDTIVLARPINDIFNLLVKLQIFPYYFELI